MMNAAKVLEGCLQFVQRDYTTCEVHNRGLYGTPTFHATYCSGSAEREHSLSPQVCSDEGRGVRVEVGRGVRVEVGFCNIVLHFCIMLHLVVARSLQ